MRLSDDAGPKLQLNFKVAMVGLKAPKGDKANAQAVQERTVLRWNHDMVEHLLELRFDTSQVCAKRSQKSKNNISVSEAWHKLELCFNEVNQRYAPIDAPRLKFKIDKLKTEYRQCIAKFREYAMIYRKQMGTKKMTNTELCSLLTLSLVSTSGF